MDGERTACPPRAGGFACWFFASSRKRTFPLVRIGSLCPHRKRLMMHEFRRVVVEAAVLAGNELALVRARKKGRRFALDFLAGKRISSNCSGNAGEGSWLKPNSYSALSSLTATIWRSSPTRSRTSVLLIVPDEYVAPLRNS